MTGALDLIWVGIDGRGDNLSGGQSVSFDLTPGEHQLEVGWGSGDNVYEYSFEVEIGETKRAVVAMGKGLRFEQPVEIADIEPRNPLTPGPDEKIEFVGEVPWELREDDAN